MYILKIFFLNLIVYSIVGFTFAIPVSPFIPFVSSVPWIFLLFGNFIFNGIVYFFNKKVLYVFYFFLFFFVFLSIIFYFFQTGTLSNFLFEKVQLFGFVFELYKILLLIFFIDISYIYILNYLGESIILKSIHLFIFILNLVFLFYIFNINKVIYDYKRIENDIVYILEEKKDFEVDYVSSSMNSSYNSIDLKLQNDSKDYINNKMCRYTITRYKVYEEKKGFKIIKDTNEDYNIYVGPHRNLKECYSLYNEISKYLEL